MPISSRIAKSHGVDPGKGNAYGWQKQAVADGDYTMDVSGVSANNHTGTDVATAPVKLADGTYMNTEVRGGSIGEGVAGNEMALHLQTDGDVGRLRVNDYFDAAHQVTLGNLDHLSFDYFIQSSSRTDVIPVIRLLIDADGDLSTTNDQGSLVFEYANQGFGPTQAGSWHSVDILAGNWIAWENAHSHNFFDQASDYAPFSAWSSAAGYGPMGGLHFDANSVVIGWEIALGSSNGANDMYLDHLHVAGQTINFA